MAYGTAKDRKLYGALLIAETVHKPLVGLNLRGAQTPAQSANEQRTRLASVQRWGTRWLPGCSL